MLVSARGLPAVSGVSAPNGAGPVLAVCSPNAAEVLAVGSPNDDTACAAVASPNAGGVGAASVPYGS